MDASSLHGSLGRLLPHVDTCRIALTGGVAIGIHLGASRGERFPGVDAHDIDLVAAAPDAVRATVIDDFLVSHFHLPQPGYAKFLIQLVDPRTRLRIDIFPDASGMLARARPVTGMPSLPFALVDAGDILDHKLATLAKSSPETPDDPKHYDDAVRLGALLGRYVPRVPDAHLRAGEFSRDLEVRCDRCAASTSAEFPLAAKREIHALLGYV